jgi:hypothetical protein
MKEQMKNKSNRMRKIMGMEDIKKDTQMSTRSGNRDIKLNKVISKIKRTHMRLQSRKMMKMILGLM